MPHDATKVLMGMGYSSDRDVTTENADPATFRAGLAVRRSDAGGLLLADNGTAALIGISAGASLSDTAKTAVFRSGLRIPILLNPSAGVQAQLVNEAITYYALEPGIEGNLITIEKVGGATAGAETVTVTGFDIQIAIEPGVTTALQVTEAIDANPASAALIWYGVSASSTVQSIMAKTPLAGGADGDLSFAAPGKAVLIDDTNGKASDTGDATGGVYSSGPLYGVFADGHLAAVALVDIPGGL